MTGLPNRSYLNDINAGDIVQDDLGDRWKVIGEHCGKIVCVDEPMEDDCDLPHISVWEWEDFQKMTLV
jgi:hypothetical protein